MKVKLEVTPNGWTWTVEKSGKEIARLDFERHLLRGLIATKEVWEKFETAMQPYPKLFDAIEDSFTPSDVYSGIREALEEEEDREARP